MIYVVGLVAVVVLASIAHMIESFKRRYPAVDAPRFFAFFAILFLVLMGLLMGLLGIG